jgi:hypothetical protein
MGISFSHCEATWSYTGFHDFRDRIMWQVFGAPLDSMRGHGGEFPWESLPDDPIKILLDHSDCDGHFSPEDCTRLAPRLKEIIQKWTDDPEDVEEGYDKRMALRLVGGCLMAALKGETLLFQ